MCSLIGKTLSSLCKRVADLPKQTYAVCFPKSFYTHTQKGQETKPPVAWCGRSCAQAGECPAASAGGLISSTADAALGVLASLPFSTYSGIISAWPLLIRNNFPLFNNTVSEDHSISQHNKELGMCFSYTPPEWESSSWQAPLLSLLSFPFSHLTKPLREMISA